MLESSSTELIVSAGLPPRFVSVRAGWHIQLVLRTERGEFWGKDNSAVIVARLSGDTTTSSGISLVSRSQQSATLRAMFNAWPNPYKDKVIMNNYKFVKSLEAIAHRWKKGDLSHCRENYGNLLVSSRLGREDSLRYEASLPEDLFLDSLVHARKRYALLRHDA